MKGNGSGAVFDGARRTTPHADRNNVLFRRLSCLSACFIASSSSLGFRKPCKPWSRPRIALYASLISPENLFLSVSSAASLHSLAHRSICQQLMMPSLSALAPFSMGPGQREHDIAEVNRRDCLERTIHLLPAPSPRDEP